MRRTLTEPTEIFATGDSYAAKGFIYPDGKVKLLKGTVICPYATNSIKPSIITLRNDLLSKKAIGTTLSVDVWFKDCSEAASVLSGRDKDGNELFKTIDNIPLSECFEIDVGECSASNRFSSQLTEGKVVEAIQNRYERNREARTRCIEHYGARCAICGFDFKEAYGDDFAGIIQVHHIMPISKVGEEYIVDPIKDLIPVCPNCHVALHSRKDGVYSPSELRSFMKSRKG